MVDECRAILLDVILQVNSPDEWKWLPNQGDGIVRGGYQFFTHHEDHHLDTVLDNVWHKKVLLKVAICVWRLSRNRLSTKDNLVRRHIISTYGHFCVSGCGHIESTQHLFLHCNLFSSLWMQVRTWIGFNLVDPNNIMDHFIQFSHFTGGSCARRNFLQLLWFASV